MVQQYDDARKSISICLKMLTLASPIQKLQYASMLLPKTEIDDQISQWNKLIPLQKLNQSRIIVIVIAYNRLRTV